MGCGSFSSTALLSRDFSTSFFVLDFFDRFFRRFFSFSGSVVAGRDGGNLTMGMRIILLMIVFLIIFFLFFSRIFFVTISLNSSKEDWLSPYSGSIIKLSVNIGTTIGFLFS